MFLHLSDANVGYIIASMENISSMNGDKMEAIRKLSDDVGCSVSTIYRIYKGFLVAPNAQTDIRYDPVEKHERTVASVVNIRHEAKEKSKINACRR